MRDDAVLGRALPLDRGLGLDVLRKIQHLCEKVLFSDMTWHCAYTCTVK